jgi:hypothetical protein
LQAGAVALVSSVASEIPSDREILEACCEWLHVEKRLLCVELCPENGEAATMLSPCAMLGPDVRNVLGQTWRTSSQPSARAGAVLEMVGLLPRERAASLGIRPCRR